MNAKPFDLALLARAEKLRLTRQQSGLSRRAFCLQYGFSAFDLYQAENGVVDAADLLGAIASKGVRHGRGESATGQSRIPCVSTSPASRRS